MYLHSFIGIIYICIIYIGIIYIGIIYIGIIYIGIIYIGIIYICILITRTNLHVTYDSFILNSNKKTAEREVYNLSLTI